MHSALVITSEQCVDPLKRTTHISETTKAKTVLLVLLWSVNNTQYRNIGNRVPKIWKMQTDISNFPRSESYQRNLTGRSGVVKPSLCKASKSYTSHILGRRYPVPDIDRLPEKNWPTCLTIQKPKSGSPDVGAQHMCLEAKSHREFWSRAWIRLFISKLLFGTLIVTCLSRLAEARIVVNSLIINSWFSARCNFRKIIGMWSNQLNYLEERKRD